MGTVNALDKLRGEFAAGSPDEIASWTVSESWERHQIIGRIGYPGDRTVHYARGEREIALAIHTVAGDTFEFFDNDAIGLALILAVDMG